MQFDLPQVVCLLSRLTYEIGGVEGGGSETGPQRLGRFGVLVVYPQKPVEVNLYTLILALGWFAVVLAG